MPVGAGPLRAVERAKAAVLLHITSFSATGGGPHAVCLLAEELVARGYRLELFTRPPLRRGHQYVRWLGRLGVPIHVSRWFEEHWLTRAGELASSMLLSIPYAAVKRRSPFFAWRAAASVFRVRVARLERWTIRRALTAALQRQRKSTDRVLLHVWGPAITTPVLLEWAAEHGVPAIYHEMGEADERYIRTWALESTIDALNRAQRVICCSPSVAESLRRVYRYQGEILTIPFMTRDPGVRSASPPRDRAGRLTLGTIGRLVPHKRHRDLIEALKRLRDQAYDVDLLIAGEGTERAALEDLARRLGVGDYVTFTGEFESLEEVMARFDVFVLASASESQSMPITESMAYGKPVVASDFGGVPDFLEDGVTGFLFPVGDVPALARKVGQLAADPGLRQAMGRQGRQRYLERYTPSHVADAVEAAYDALWPTATAGRPPAGTERSLCADG